jgi:hypothetical protein
MANRDVSFPKRAVIEFLVKEEIPTTDFSMCMDTYAWVLVVLDDG